MTGRVAVKTNEYVQLFPVLLLLVFITNQIIRQLHGFSWSQIDYSDVLSKTLRIGAKYLLWLLPVFIVEATVCLLQFPSMWIWVISNIEKLAFVVLMIFFLRELKIKNIKYKYIIFLVLIIPVVIHVTGITFGLLFSLFQPKVETTGTTGLLGLLNLFDNKYFNPFSHIYSPFPTLLSSLWGIISAIQSKDIYLYSHIFVYPILSLIILFQYSFYFFFKQNNKSPFLSFIPVVNVLVLAKICNVPLSYKILLFIPFVRIYYFYKINEILSNC